MPPLPPLTGPLKAKALAKAVSDMVKAHFDAFVVELVGAQASGLSPARLQDLLAAGVLDQNKLGGLKLPGMRADCDPFGLILGAAHVFERAQHAEQRQMAAWELSDWKRHVDDLIATRGVQANLPLGGRVAVSVADYPALAALPVLPHAVAPHQEPQALAGAGGGQPPAWLAPTEAAAWGQARTRAGEFARGLGNAAAEDMEKTIAEVWDGEDIVQEVMPGRRAERLDILRDLVANAMETHRDAGQLARDLADATGDYSHNWQRIAETELQGAFNEGVVIAAGQTWGQEARIARIPESGACDNCTRLFLDDSGRPRIWTIAEIVANGTNVGKKAKDWLACVWPIHPRCRCSTISVPPGPYYVTAGGAIRRIGEEP